MKKLDSQRFCRDCRVTGNTLFDFWPYCWCKGAERPVAPPSGIFTL